MTEIALSGVISALSYALDTAEGSRASSWRLAASAEPRGERTRCLHGARIVL
jgi:hypothetical protein